MWNQRRPLVAYWRRKERPSYLQLRFLRDGYDFSDAQIFTAQKHRRVLAGLVLATDTGDKHVSRDLFKNATSKTEDLRLRSEIGGKDAVNVLTTVPALTNQIQLTSGNISLQLSLPSELFAFEGAQGWNVTRDKHWLNIDNILHTGVEK